MYRNSHIWFPSDQIKMIISDQIWFLSDQIKILKSNQNQISLWSNQNSHIWSNLTSRHLSAHWSLHSHLHLHRREDSNHLNIASLNKTSKCSNMSRSPYRQMVQTWPASTTSPGSTFTTTTSAFIGAPTWHNSHYLSAEYIIGYSTATEFWKWADDDDLHESQCHQEPWAAWCECWLRCCPSPWWPSSARSARSSPPSSRLRQPALGVSSSKMKIQQSSGGASCF